MSPEMTAVYARLHLDTVRRHWESALKVNADGNPADLPDGHPLATAQWIRLSMVRRPRRPRHRRRCRPRNRRHRLRHRRSSRGLPLLALHPGRPPRRYRRAHEAPTRPPPATGRGQRRIAASAPRSIPGQRKKAPRGQYRPQAPPRSRPRGDPPAPRPRTAPGRLTRPEKRHARHQPGRRRRNRTCRNPPARRQTAHRRPRTPHRLGCWPTSATPPTAPTRCAPTWTASPSSSAATTESSSPAKNHPEPQPQCGHFSDLANEAAGPPCLSQLAERQYSNHAVFPGHGQETRTRERTDVSAAAPPP